MSVAFIEYQPTAEGEFDAGNKFDQMVLDNLGISYSPRASTTFNLGARVIATTQYKNAIMLVFNVQVLTSAVASMKEVLIKGLPKNSDKYNFFLGIGDYRLPATLMEYTFSRSGEKYYRTCTMTTYVFPGLFTKFSEIVKNIAVNVDRISS